MDHPAPSTISRKVQSLPNTPGVYIWKDSSGRVLYVGKAKRLRDRVRQYHASDHTESPKTRALVRKAADLETIVVPTESQALLLENNLIKEWRPRFNIALRDDKSYPRIAVTVGEPFPRVLVVRKLDVPGARYFGPYTDVAVLRRTLRVIRRIFTVRSCHYRLLDETPERPCLDYHIGRCLAPCVRYQDERSYQAMIDEVLRFLEGKTVEVRTNLRQRMEGAARELDFERAAEMRNSLRWLEQLEVKQSIEFIGSGDADAIGYARDGGDAVGVILRVRQGRVVAAEHRFLENLAEESDANILTAFLVRYYVSFEERGRTAVLPFVPADFAEVQDLLPNTEWLIPQRGTNYRLVEVADQNARHTLESLRIESLEADERVEDPVYALGRDLGLTSVPRNFICIDISTNQGKDTVGSLVWFEGGRAKKSHYRRYKIKGEAQQDDFAAVHEVVTRFLARSVREEKPLPDLIVIDGGKGQLSAATRALEESSATIIPIIALAKKAEEVFFPSRSDSLKLSRRAPSLRLLQRARDEAHRFAVEYNRRRRTQRTLTSELLNIPGIGPEKRRALLERFGSLAGIRSASIDEIKSLSGFSEKLALRVHAHLIT